MAASFVASPSYMLPCWLPSLLFFPSINTSWKVNFLFKRIFILKVRQYLSSAFHPTETPGDLGAERRPPMVVIHGLRTTALAGLATLRESSSRGEREDRQGREEISREEPGVLSLKWRINKRCCSVRMADFLISAVPDTGVGSTPLSWELKNGTHRQG